MAYYELTHAGCLHFEDSGASMDIRVLGRMANAALSVLEGKTPKPVLHLLEKDFGMDSIEKMSALEKRLHVHYSF